jgi:hypothetical protein
MKRLLLPLWALAYASFAVARPLVIEAPDQLPFIWGAVGLAGNELIAMVRTTEISGPPEVGGYFANLYHRNASGQWVFDRTLVHESSQDYLPRATVVMNASIAAIAMPGGLRIFERTNAGWTESALDVSPRPQGQPLDLLGTSILATEGGCAARALELRRLANGHWVLAATLPVAAGTCITSLDLDANAAIVRSTVDLDTQPNVRILERGGNGAWSVAANFSSNESVPQLYAYAVAIHGDLALASGQDHGAYVYRRGASGWAAAGNFDNPDGGEWDADGSIQITDQYILRVGGNLNRNTGAGYLYRERADHTFEHLANLVGTRDTGLSLAFLEGNRAIGLGGDIGNQPLEFNLPASFVVPALEQDDFESNAAQWTPLPGSQFAIASNGTTHVYRQSSLAGDAGAIHAADMTDQSVGADIRLNAVNGADRWVGLMTRYTDASNHYYVTLRDSNVIVLKRMVNGVYTDLGSATINVAPGQTFHINIESSGSHHAVDVDGQRIIRAYDRSLTHGHAGLRMYKAAADFDNVVVSPGPVSNLVYADRATMGGNWTGTITNFQQTTVGATARRTSGVPREDQVVQASIAVNSFANGGSPWVGLIARYEDAGNYYYVTARKNNQLSLRKLTNGAITELDTVPFTITPHTFFVLRLEAIGDRLRVYVNDELRIERTGAEVVAGKVGVMTYLAAASFGAYAAYEP